MSRFYISFPLTLWDVCMFLSVDTFLPDSLCMIQFLRALLAFHLSFSISASFHLFFSHSLPGQVAHHSGLEYRPPSQIACDQISSLSHTGFQFSHLKCEDHNNPPLMRLLGR